MSKLIESSLKQNRTTVRFVANDKAKHMKSGQPYWVSVDSALQFEKNGWGEINDPVYAAKKAKEEAEAKVKSTDKSKK